MRYEIRPLGPWTDRVTDPRPLARFRAGWQDTLDLISRETHLLGAELVVLQVDVTDGEIRRDGMLRAQARVGFPGVRLSFGSIHGPLTYATDAYDSWRANVRAIALALDALRAVDRYGVTSRGEQYTGWRAIEAPNRSAPAMTVEQAAQFLVEHADLPPTCTPTVIYSQAERQRAYRAAAARLHPDRGGDSDQFALLTIAMETLGATS